MLGKSTAVHEMTPLDRSPASQEMEQSGDEIGTTVGCKITMFGHIIVDSRFITR